MRSWDWNHHILNKHWPEPPEPTKCWNRKFLLWPNSYEFMIWSLHWPRWKFSTNQHLNTVHQYDHNLLKGNTSCYMARNGEPGVCPVCIWRTESGESFPFCGTAKCVSKEMNLFWLHFSQSIVLSTSAQLLSSEN